MSKKYIFNNVARYYGDFSDIAPFDKEFQTKITKCTCYLINIFGPQHINNSENMNIKSKNFIIESIFDKIIAYIDNPTDETKIELYRYADNGNLVYNFLNKYLQEFVNDIQLHSQFEGIIENNIDRFFINIINQIFEEKEIVFTDLKQFITHNSVWDLNSMTDAYMSRDNINVNTELFNDILNTFKQIFIQEMSDSMNINRDIINIIHIYLSGRMNDINIFTYLPSKDIIDIIFKYKKNIKDASENLDFIFMEGFNDIHQFINSNYTTLITELKGKTKNIVQNIIENNKITILLSDYIMEKVTNNIYTSLSIERRDYIKKPELSELVHPNTLITSFDDGTDDNRYNIIYTINELVLKLFNIKINIYTPGSDIINYIFDNVNMSDQLLLKTGVYELPTDILYNLSELTEDEIKEYNSSLYSNMDELMHNATETDIIISSCEYYCDKQNIIKKYI